ncbi:DUF294 nucleotidyltransferase-like domain-containing protein [Galbibacter pacificus]|uniref:DUF294 nucleotidyltransferase-like domain-containing protein n=1 Tax=Galbibacter pacificus TaxID=2996052 RepID=A0ABT6FPE5_9FLAO|nr:DUF294 nucleotidyltransferase-like domain-containing protein [Galbibacter pacificus]MDG3581646.1 DUF294 nucleotidyltransferase-like domain-containing protein [Galbibacter pacificus]MDG3585124.1 DUF294 nucleotidyltransferase-like domain-containing protein [Galbibacter pacificus]
MKNTIAERIADFLKRFPPFDLLKPHQLLDISREVKVVYVQKGDTIFNQGDEGHSQFYVVQKGAVAIQRKENGQTDTLDKCDEGDIFGLRPLFAKENYMISANAEEESILYAIPIEIFQPLIKRNYRVGQFLIESFASNTRNPYSREHRGKLYTENEIQEDSAPELFELQPVQYVKNIISCTKNTAVSTVAKLMSAKNVGSVLVVENEIPLGIVTDKDIRNTIAVGIYPIDIAVEKIMSAPVICYAKGLTIAQAQVAMMKHKISHLCITKDGTPNTKVLGIVSEHDIIVSQGNNPAVLIKAIERANKSKVLKAIHERIMHLLNGYLQQNIPMTHVSKIMFELNDATIKRVIERSLEKIKTPPPVKFAWMSLGSQGRKEQLLHTDQDNAIVFEDVPENKLEATKAYFLELAKLVNKGLNNIGFDYCPADMMARNPNYTLSLQEWKKQFTEWMTSPGNDEILLCSIFFDYDISYGDVWLTNQISDHIFKLSENNQLFLTALASSSIRSASPLGFFRQFLVETNGEYKDFFDLKKRAIMPITDAGRVLILQHKIKNINNTAERFEKLAELEPQNRELYLSCSYTAKALLKFRTKQGLLHNDTGRFIELDTLSKEEKIKLKRCFKTINDVQELIKLRFKITAFL